MSALFLYQEEDYDGVEIKGLWLFFFSANAERRKLVYTFGTWSTEEHLFMHRFSEAIDWNSVNWAL